MTNQTKNTNLIAYQQHNLSLDNHVQKIQEPNCNMSSETKLVFDNCMYTGGLRKINFGRWAVYGKAYVRLWNEKTHSKDSSALERMTTAIYAALNLATEHEGKKYFRQWDCTLPSYSTILQFDCFGKLFPPFFEDMHFKIRTEQNVNISKSILSRLFDPLLVPIGEEYSDIRNF